MKNRIFNKRVLSFLLTLLMIVGVFPTGAFAVSANEETQPVAESTAVAKVGNTEYATVDDAVSAAQAGDTITILAAVAGVEVAISKDITLDLGGKTITDAYIQIAANVTIKNGSIKNTNESYPLVVNSGALTVKNVAIEASKSDRTIWLKNSGTVLNFNSGSILATKGENNIYSKIYGVWVSQGATANINGGTIEVDAGADATAVAIFGNYVNTVNITGGKIYTSGKTYSYAVWTDGDVTVTGGEIVTNKKGYGYSSGITYGKNYAINTKGDVEITGGKITTNGPSGYLVNAGGSNQTVTISDVEFTNVLSEADKTAGGHSEPNLIYGSSVNATITGGEFEGVNKTLIKGTDSTLTVSGGSFSDIDEAYVKTGATVTVAGQEMTKTDSGLAPVTPTEVSTHDELVAALANGGKIKLTADITVDAKITAIDGTVIDLNGKTLYINVEDSYYNNVTIKNGNIILGKDDVHVCNGYFLVNEGKTLVVDDVEVSSSAEGIKGYAVFHLKTGANLDLNNSTLNIANNEYAAGYIVYAGESTATVDVVDTTVTGNKVNGIVHAATVIENSAFTITNAIEHGINRSGVTITDSTVAISGGTGRGITAQHGPLVINGNSIVTISDMGEATIELRNNQNLTIAETATVKLDAAVNNTTSGTVSGNVTVDTTIGAVAVIGNVGYKSFADALAATKTMTGDVVVEIFEKVTIDGPINGSFDSIKFVGMDADADAEIYIDLQGYVEAAGKKVAFENLKLSKVAGGYVANAGFMNLAFGIFGATEVTYTNCIFVNGAYASSGKNTFSGCTFYRSHDRYGMWAYGAEDIVVDGCTFDDFRGIKMYDEGKAGTTSITVKNTDFTKVDNKPAIVLTYGESVTLEKNTYSSTGVFELDLGGDPNGVAVTTDVLPTCKNDNGVCGVLVDGKIYTTVAQAAEVAVAGYTVTLLHNSVETVEFVEGVILDKNGFEAAGITVKAPNYVAQIGDNKYETLEDAIAAACNDPSITYIEILADYEQTEVKNTNTYYDITQNLTIGAKSNVRVTGCGFAIRVKGNDARLTIENTVTIEGLNVVANGFGTTGEDLIIEGTFKALSLKQWTSNGTITVGTTGSVWLGYGDGQFDMAFGNGTVTIIGTGDETVQFKAGYSGTRGNGNTLNLTNTVFEGGAWFKVDGSNGTFNINNSVLKVSGGDGAGNLTVASSGNIFNLTNGAELRVATLVLGEGNTLKVDCTSKVVTNLSGAGKIIIDATGFNGEQPISGDASGFTGTLEVINNNKCEAKIVDGKIVIVEKILSGSGTEEDPYLINNVDDLLWFQAKVDEQAADGSTQFAGKYFKLTADIDLTGINWNPIGSKTGDHGSFKGVFDGAGHTISNLYVEQAGEGLGLFAYTSGNAVIKNLNLVNVTVKSTNNSNYVGGLVGNAYASTKIENVHISGDVLISGRGYIGGIAGHGYVVMDNVSVKANEGGLITSTFWCAGGILGYAGEGVTNITNAHVEGLTVTSAAGGLGAIVGMAEDNDGTQPISGSNLSAKNVVVKTYKGGYGTAYEDYAIGYLYGGNPTSKLTGTLEVENVTLTTASGNAASVVDAVAIVNGSVYFDLQTALKAGGEVKILRDIILTKTLVVPAGKTVILDLNGKTITTTITEKLTKSFAMFTNKGNFTVIDSGNDIEGGINGKISLNYTADSFGYGIGLYVISNEGGTLTVNDGRIENLTTVSGSMYDAIDNNSTLGNTYLTINGGEIYCAYLGIRQFANSTTFKNVVTINGGKVKGGNSAIWIQNPGSAQPKANVVITKGDIEGRILAGESTEFAVAVSGGTFTVAVPEEFCVEGYIPATNADGTYGVKKGAYVAQVGNVKYETLEEAFKAATEGCTIEILADVVIDYKWDCRDYATNGSHSQFKESVTINGNGHTIKFTGTVNDSNWNTIFRFEENATVKNLTVDISEATGAQRVISAKKSLIVDGLTIIGSAKYGIIFGESAIAADLAAAEIVITNSTLTGTRRAISDNEGGKDVKSVTITGNTLSANVYVSASENITFNNNTASGEVDLRSYAAENVLSVEAKGNTLTEGVKNYIYAKTVDAQVEFTAQRPAFKVATKAELNAALAAAQDGDTIILTADIDYGTDQLKVEKAITLDLGGKTLTTRNAWGGMSVKNNPTIKNGNIVHASNTAAIKVWNATAFEDLVIDVQGKGDANKTIGGIVLQSGSTTRVGSIKNVTIKGAALTNGIETYNCGDATENVIGSMENVIIDAKGTGMLISAPCGTATNCDIKGGTNGIEIWIKGNYSASLDLVNSKVEGGVFAHDEFSSNPDVVNNGKLSLTVDAATTGVSVADVTVTIARAEKFEGVIKDVIDKAQAKINNTYYITIADAIKAAKAGDVVTVFEGTYAVPSMKAGITIVGDGDVMFEGTLTGTLENLTLKNIHIKGGNAQRWAYAKGDLVFENVTFEATSVYALHFDGITAGATLLYKDCTIIGWAAMSGSPASCVFDGCTIKGNGTYGLIRTYFDATIENCTFDVANVNTTDAYQDGIHAVSGATVTVNNCTNANGNMKDIVNVNGASVVVLDGEKIQNVAKIGDNYYATLDAAFAAAKDGDEVKILVAGTYALSTSGKDITITGAVDGVVFDNIGAKGMNGASVTFNNVTFNYADNSTYKGLQHCGNMVYNDCTFNGQVFLYGASETFNNCTFKQTTNNYNVWTYGAKEVAFNECTFNSAGKAVLIYAESAGLFNDVTVTGCTFKASAAVDGKAAIEMDSSLTAGINLTIDAATTATGFGTGNVSGNSLWNNKKGNNTDANNDITVVVGDTTVLAPVTFVAKIGKIGYTTLADALAAAGTGAVVIELVADATLDYDARDAFGAADTTSITINGNGKTLTLNQKNSDWASIGLAKADAKLVLNNMTIEKTGYGDTSGAWNTHAIIFSCNVEMNNVTVNNSVAVQNGATLNKVTINEAGEYYGLWINGNGQTVTMNGGAINATNGGRGIKIADQYVDAPASVTLNVTGTKFTTAKKAAVLVSSKAGANITASNVDITNVAADKVNFVWVDEDWAANYGKVTVTGASVTQEELGTFKAAIVNGDKVVGYYKTLEAAIEAADEGKTITLLADIEATAVILIDKSITINGNGHKVTSSATRVFRVTTANVEVTLNEVNMVSAVVRVGTNDVRGISIDNVDGVKLTLNNCSVDFTDASANDWAYAVNVTGGSNHTLTVNDGTYEGANVINVHGAKNTIFVKDATLTSTYPNNDVYYGACIWVEQKKDSSVEATGNTFNGANAVAFNVGTGTTVTESNNIDNTTRVVAKIGGTYYTSLADAIAAAQSGNEVKILVAGTYALTTSGKNITITGAVDGVVFDNIGAHNMGGANVTFNNVTFDYYPNVNYTGLQHSGNLVYNDCTFNGQVFLYGASETFNKCTFNQDSANAYNVWTYGAKEVAFNECTFNSVGKSVLIYAEQASIFNKVAVTDCTFKASAAVEGKAAIEMDSSLTSGIELTITNSTVEGFGTGNVSGNSLWNNKKDNKTDANNDITVVVDGVTVLAPVKFIVQIGNDKYASLQEAIAEVKNGETIVFLADIDEDVTIKQASNVAFTIDGKNFKYYGTMTVNGIGGEQGQALTIQNVNFVVDGYGISANEKKNYARNITVDGCTFTGEGYDDYGMIFHSVYNIVVKNTTGNKMFDLVYGRGSVTGFAAENVEVINSTNGIVLSYVNSTATFKNVNTTVAEDGVLIRNGATGNVYFEECGIDTIKYWNNDNCTGSVTMCFVDTTNNLVIEGVSDNLAIKLNKVDTTVAAIEDLNATTDVAGYRVAYENGKYFLVKLDYVAQVGDTKYESIQAAVNAAQNGETIVILKDHELTWDGKTFIDDSLASMVVVAGKTVTIDLNGKKLTVDANKLTKDLYAVFAADNGGHLTMMDSVGGGSVSATGVGYKKNNSVTAYCLMMAYEDGTSLTINGGTYYMESAHDSLIYSGDDEIVVVNDGNFTLGNVGYAPTTGNNGKPWIFNVLGANVRKVIVNGGTFNADIDSKDYQYWQAEVAIKAGYCAQPNGDGTWTIKEHIVEFVPGKEPTATEAGYTESEKCSDCGKVLKASETIVAKGTVATIGKVCYATLAEALAAAKADDKVKLVVDTTESMVMLTKGITLDLNGHTLTAGYLVAFNGNHVVDNATEKGLLKISKSNISLAKDNSMMPVYNGTDGYLFVAANLQYMVNKEDITEDEFKVVYRPSLGKAYNYLLADGAKDNELQMIVRISWIDNQGANASQEFVFTEDLIARVYTNNKGLELTISGLTGYQNITVEVVLLSDKGVENTSKVLVFNPTTAVEG